ncbi:MAG: DUF3592 domain-containing protein [Saprospiraceae bacterium]|nr:DUF3592 domain-containing protein [Saprospiraceae bacterium]MDW8229412.1 DUF3592 domain-containing protein [Saprospiraceae bacterium]
MKHILSNSAAVVLGGIVLLLLLFVVVISLVVGLLARQWEAVAFGVILAGLVGYNVWRLAQRALQMRRLATEGVAAVAYVEEIHARRSTRGGRRYWLTYRYTAPDGRTLRHTPAVSSEQALRLKSGDLLRIVYLPENPAISALEEDVEKMRRALQKTGQ